MKKKDAIVPHSREQLEVFAAAARSGAIFAATGGEYFTSDDMIKMAEVLPRKATIAEVMVQKSFEEINQLTLCRKVNL